MSLVIENREYVVYVKILAGEGDGPLIYIDAQGRIHVGGGDPGPEVRGQLESAADQIRTAVDQAKHAIGKIAAKKK